jgi:hypothetical protein
VSFEFPKHAEPRWEWAQKIAASILGNNPHGQPMYRFVWGEDRLEFVGQKWEDRDEDGKLIREVTEERQVPKYSHLGAEHWFLERWYPAEHFGTKAWWEKNVIDTEDGRRIPARGPYPANGDYDYAFIVEGPNGEYRELTFARVEWLADVVRDCERKNAFARLVAQRAETELRKQMSKEIDLRMLEEATPAFSGQLRRGTAIVVP